MPAAVPFADPLIKRATPADRAPEGIESYLEADRIGNDPGEGDRRLLASADQPLHRQHRTNPPVGAEIQAGVSSSGSSRGGGGFRSSKNPTRQA